MKPRILWKIFAWFVSVTLVSIFVLNFIASLWLRSDFENKITDKLGSNAILVGDILKADIGDGAADQIQRRVNSLAGQLDLRITIIDASGLVLGDSEKDPTGMESHVGRDEVVKAMEDGFGQSRRWSDTLGYAMKYVAVRVDENGRKLGVVRFALPLSDVQLEVRTIYRAILLSAVAAAVISLVFAYYVSRGISRPIRQMQLTARRIAKGDFTRKVTIKSRDELGELARSLNTMADELQEQMSNLKKMDQVRTDFVANVSHELRTPLTSIKGFIETLEDGAINDPEKAKRFVSIIKKHSVRLENIIEDLSTLSELEARPGKISKAQFDLKELVEEAALGFGHALAQKDIDLEILCQTDNRIINGDSDKIEQVVVNLFANAIKYNKVGGRIEIVISGGEDNLTMIVRDTGIGIPAEDLERVFERFYRVDKGRSRELGGTGLGLGIAKHIVIAHGGEIEVESEVGAGTAVTVNLPRSSFKRDN